MRWWTKIIAALVSGLATLSAVKGVFLWLASKQIYPEQWISRMISGAESAIVAHPAITWIILGASGLFGLVIGPSLYDWGIGLFGTKRKEKQSEESASGNVNIIEPSPLISLVELLKEAEKQGWQFTTYDSQHIFDFASALRDAGSTETIQFWGRKEQRIGGMVEETPPTRIGSGYWETCWIRGLSCLKVLDGMFSNIFAENFQTITESPNGRNCLYNDIHLDRNQALSWLQHQVPQSMIDTSERPQPRP